MQPLELFISIAQPLCACSLFHHFYPTTAGASALRAVACVAAGNGVLALACLAKTSPLTFRWALCSVMCCAVVLGWAALARSTAWLCCC